MMTEDIDSPETISQHRDTIQRKAFLKRVYLYFYQQLSAALPPQTKGGVIVELGSGGGFLKDIIPGVVTSDVVPAPGIDKVFSAQSMPFADASVDAIVMLNCFHHFSDARQALKEFSRCLKPGGKVVMVEPSNTWLRRWIDRRFHREPFDPAAGWQLSGQGRLSGANGALPWIVFTRDRDEMTRLFPQLSVVRVELHSPLKYLASGGLFYPAFLPGALYPLVAAVDQILRPWYRWLAYFQTIELRKT